MSKDQGEGGILFESRPAVGLAIFVRRKGRLLFGKRCSARGYGKWCVPGGHLEAGETFVECARRETYEETGIQIQRVEILTITNDVFRRIGEHYVTVIAVADYYRGTVQLMEPENFSEWGWYSWSEPPRPLAKYLGTLKAQGFDPFKDIAALQLVFPWKIRAAPKR